VAGQRPAQAHVAGGKCVGLVQLPHGDVLRRPRADAVDAPQPCDDLVQRPTRAEHARVVGDGPRQADERPRPRARHRQQRRIERGNRRRCGKNVREPSRVAGGKGQRLSAGPQEHGAEFRRGRHGDLLSEHRSDADLEPVPPSRHAEPRTRRHEPREARILRELRADHLGIGREVEETADACDDARQGRQPGAADRDRERIPRCRPDAQHPMGALGRERPRVPLLVHRFEPLDRARTEEGEHRLPVIGPPVRQAQRHLPAARGVRRTHRTPELARRTMVEVLEGFVEPSDAAKAGGERDVAHRQRGIVDQLLGEEDAARLRHGDRRGPQVLPEQAPQLAFADAEASREAVHHVLVESAAFDQRERPGDRVRRTPPGGEIGRRLRPAAQARPESRFLRRGGGREELDVLALRRARRADRPAVHAGGANPDEEPAIEAGITAAQRAIAGTRIELHGPILPRGRPGV